MTKLRKFFASSVMVMTVVVMSGLTAPMTTNAAASAGDLIKKDGLSAVYYLGQDGKRYVFPNEATYKSWYSDFSGVVTISADELASYPLGGNVVVRPGTKLVKITTDPKVYAVEANGTLRQIPNEAAAIALYGADWAKRVIDVADSFFTNYTIGSPLASNEVPMGSLVKKTGETSIYYFDGTNYRLIEDEVAFLANRFQYANVLTLSSFTAGGSTITGAEAGIIKTSQGGSTGTVVTGSGVTVALNSTTPVAGDLPKSTSNTVLKFNITAANDGPAIISGVKLTAIGLGDPRHIKQISVYKDNVKLNNTARDIDSNKEAQINFTNAVSIPAGTTAVFEVKATFSDTTKHGLSIAKSSDVTAGNTVSGSFPVTGNIFTAVDVTVGDLDISKDGSALSDVKLGDKAATIAKFKLSNTGSVENIAVKALTFKKEATSSASDSAIENLKLNYDGKVVASVASISNRYVTFVLSTPITINKNTSNKRISVTADVVDGAGKNIGLMLESTSDVVSTGDYYGFQTTISGNATSTGLLASIKAGSISLEKVNASNDKLREDVDNQEVGTFKVTVNSGKNAELSTLRLSITSSNDNQSAASAFTKIENVEVYNRTNGTVYDLSYASGTGTKVYRNTSMGLMLTSGVTNELVVRFDTLAGSSAKDYTVSIADAQTDLIIKEVANDTQITDITPNTVDLRKVTVEGVGATFSMNALSTPFTAVIGTSDVEVLNFNVKAAQNSSAFVKDLTIKKVDGNLSFNSQTISEFKLWKKGVSTPVKTMSPSQISGTDLVFTDLNEEIGANQTVTYKVTVSFVKNNDSSSKTIQFGLNGSTVEDIDGKEVTESDSVASSSRTVTLAGSGSLYVSMDNNETSVAKASYQLAGVQTGNVASLKLKAENEPVKITKLQLQASQNLNGLVSELGLYDGSTLIASTNVIATTSDIEISGNNLIVPMTSKNYYVKATLAKIGKDQTGTSTSDITFMVKGIEAVGFNSNESLVVNGADTTLSSNEIGYDNDNDGTIDASVSSTGASKEMSIVASRISAVSLPTSLGDVVSLSSSLTDGQAANAAIIAVTAPASVNTEQNGDMIKTRISKIVVNVATSSKITAYTTTIEKIGGLQSAVDGTPATSTAEFAGLTGTDYEINPGETAYFLVKVVPTFSATIAGDSSINVSLGNLATNFTWKDSATSADKTDLRLPITKVDGTTIKN